MKKKNGLIFNKNCVFFLFQERINYWYSFHLYDVNKID